MDYTETTYDDVTYRTYEGPQWRADVILLDDDGRDAYLERIDVDEGCRGQGIGTSLIREISGDYRRLWAAPDNENSARLFGRLGEKVVGEDATDAPVPYEELYYLDQGHGVYEVA